MMSASSSILIPSRYDFYEINASNADDFYKINF